MSLRRIRPAGLNSVSSRTHFMAVTAQSRHLNEALDRNQVTLVNVPTCTNWYKI